MFPLSDCQCLSKVPHHPHQPTVKPKHGPSHVMLQRSYTKMLISTLCSVCIATESKATCTASASSPLFNLRPPLWGSLCNHQLPLMSQAGT